MTHFARSSAAITYMPLAELTLPELGLTCWFSLGAHQMLIAWAMSCLCGVVPRYGGYALPGLRGLSGAALMISIL